MSIFICEAAIWLGALIFWLWPAYVRHRLMWGLWFWLHPTTPEPAKKREPERGLEYKPVTWPGILDWFGASYTEPAPMRLDPTIAERLHDQGTLTVEEYKRRWKYNIGADTWERNDAVQTNKMATLVQIVPATNQPTQRLVEAPSFGLRRFTAVNPTHWHVSY